MSILCEIMSKQIIPAVRVRVTKQLYSKHNLNQDEIAARLEITQAAVSKYLSGKYTPEIRKLEKDKIVKKISDEIVSAIVKKTFNRSSFEKTVCQCCAERMR